MRRKGHPRAITCCLFSSAQDVAHTDEGYCLAPESTSRASLSLAGFQVTLFGRFGVTTEGKKREKRLLQEQMFENQPGEGSWVTGEKSRETSLV
jgi:hypothetical protein